MLIRSERFLAAYALDWIAGDPPSMPHPVRLIGAAISTGEGWLRRPAAPAIEIAQGAALTAAVHAAEVRSRLLQEHSILVRECDSFAGLEPGRYLRIAVRRENENAHLAAALAGIFRVTACLQTHA